MDKDNKNDEGFRQIAPYWVLGSNIAGYMVVGMAGGYYLDNYLSTSPWFLLFGSFLGMFGSFISIINIATRKPHKPSGSNSESKKGDQKGG